MKSSIRYLVLACLFFPFILLSCKTTGTGTPSSLTTAPPPPAPQQDKDVAKDVSEPADDASLAELARARAAAEESRSLARYVDSEVYYPDDWKAAETRYGAAVKKDKPATKPEAAAGVTEWKAIGALYDGLYQKAAAQFVRDQEKKLAAARERAVDAGAEDIVPDRLAMADDKADSARQRFQSNDVSGSIREGREAWEKYGILETLMLARAKQVEADENDFFAVDPDNYLLAAEAGNTSVDHFDSGNLPESRRLADEAYAGFDQVIVNGWTSRVEVQASVARKWRDASREIKAHVAARSDFAAAETVYNQAHVALRARDFTDAMDLFEQSGILFMAAHDIAAEKRQIAEGALQVAAQKLAESEEKARNADDLIGGDE